jgi:adenylate kinase family enzyme
MKNIILLGCPRSGKSTFARMLKKEYPIYNYIEDDNFVSALINIFKNSTGNIEVKGKKINFRLNIPTNIYSQLGTMVYDNILKYSSDLKYIYDSMSLEPIDIIKYQNSDNLILIFGYPRLSLQEAINNIRKYDTETDWTRLETNQSLETIFDTYIKDSKRNRTFCKKHNIKFVDTSYNREKVLNELLIWVKKNI